MSIHPLTFPLDALPNTARNAAYELLQNTGAPDVIVGMSVLASMSIAAQLNYDVQLPHGVVRPTGSTFICLALPSQQKTTVDELVMKPFLDLDKAAATAQQLQRKAYRTKKDLYSLVRQGMLREIVKGEIAGESTDKLRTRLAEHEAGEPVPVQGGRIIYSNTTHRAFLEAMQGEGRFTALLSNEGEAVLISPLFRASGFLNSVWDGPSVLALDRAKGDSVVARNPRNVTFLMLQPQAWVRTMAKLGDAIQANGYATRILIGVADANHGFRTRAPDPTYEALAVFHKAIEPLAQAFSAREAGACHDKREVLDLSNDARIFLRHRNTDLEAQMAPGGSLHAVRGFASKDVEHICRIAASMHAVCGRGLTIDVHTVHQAAQIVTWFGNQTMMVFDPLGPLSPLAGKALTLLEYIRRSFWTINRPAKTSVIGREGPVRPKQEVQKCLDLLMRYGMVHVLTDVKLGPIVVPVQPPLPRV
jgi:hypothetical protein